MPESKEQQYLRAGSLPKIRSSLRFGSRKLYIVYAVLFLLLMGMIGIVGPSLKGRVGLTDLLLIGAAVHKVSWLFCRRQEGAVQKEGRSWWRGALSSCPFTLVPWVAIGFVFGLVFLPYATRIVAAIFASMTIADFLHSWYVKAQQNMPGNNVAKNYE